MISPSRFRSGAAVETFDSTSRHRSRLLEISRRLGHYPCVQMNFAARCGAVLAHYKPKNKSNVTNQRPRAPLQQSGSHSESRVFILALSSRKSTQSSGRIIFTRKNHRGGLWKPVASEYLGAPHE
jgi:hypothetical protein